MSFWRQDLYKLIWSLILKEKEEKDKEEEYIVTFCMKGTEKPMSESLLLEADGGGLWLASPFTFRTTWFPLLPEISAMTANFYWTRELGKQWKETEREGKTTGTKDRELLLVLLAFVPQQPGRNVYKNSQKQANLRGSLDDPKKSNQKGKREKLDFDN